MRSASALLIAFLVPSGIPPGTAPSALAAPLRSSTPSVGELVRGESDGIGITTRGLLFLAPTPRPVGEPLQDGTPAYTWSIALGEDGTVYAGTGPDGRVVRGRSAQPLKVLATTAEPLVTAVSTLPGGTLLAAAAPEGRIYRIDPDGSASLWSETGERYVWSLLPRPDGSVLAATGEAGRLLRIDRNGHPVVLFDSDEPHLVSLGAGRGGTVLAGGAGRGLVYRVDESGRTRVLHDDEVPEARGVVEDAEGNVFVALLSAPPPDRRPPAVRIQVGGQGQPGSEMVGELDDRDGSTLRGVIEGLPTDQDDASPTPRGKIVRVSPDGTATELWRSSTEAVFSLVLDDAGRVVFGTGEPARLYRVERDGDVALLATLREGQISALARQGRATIVGTSNPASLYRLESAPAESGVFLSRPVDAGATARWGSLTWRTSGDVGRLEYQTRSGESGEPDGTWSDWSSALTIPGGSKIESPPGRFLQWRVRMFAGGDDEGRAVPATAWFTTENRTPRVRDFRLDGTPPWVAGSAVFRWAAQDADGDPVAAAIEIRRPDAERWEVVARNALGDVKPSDLVGEPETGWKESRSTWDTTAHGEGAWDVRVVVDDRASNPPGQGKQESSEPPLRVTVDRTGPVIETNSTGGIFEIVVRDEASPVVRLEVLGEDGVIAAPDCADGVCDSSKETFRVSADLANPGPGRSLRAFDAAGNAAEAPFP